MEERRKYPRINVTTLIKFKSHSDNNLNNGEAQDISKNGICINSKKEYAKGDIITLQLFLGEKISNLEGEITWIENTKTGNYNIGLEYTKIEKQDLAEIEKYIEKIK